jgi:predicted negative regulator of RcsB-dependent stress response
MLILFYMRPVAAPRGCACHGAGDRTGAAKYAAASRLGPNWADPLKAWGDMLVKQGKPRDALEKYDQALKQAPHWASLAVAREAVTQPH